MEDESRSLLELWGVGLILSENKIINLVKNGPAHLAGLSINDMIITVDGLNIDKNSIDLSDQNKGSDLVLVVNRWSHGSRPSKQQLRFPMKRTLSLNKTWYRKDLI